MIFLVEDILFFCKNIKLFDLLVDTFYKTLKGDCSKRVFIDSPVNTRHVCSSFTKRYGF